MAEAKQVLLTPEGLEGLKEELDHLINVRRKECSEKIKIARGFGDLSENSEYDEAKDEQAAVEARIAEINEMMKYVKVIDKKAFKNDAVHVGSTVTIIDMDTQEKEKYTIVGSTEADPDNNKISDESPVGKALLGHKLDEIITVNVPGGATLNFKLIKIAKR